MEGGKKVITFEELKEELDSIRDEYRNMAGNDQNQPILEKGIRVVGVLSKALEMDLGAEVIITGGFSVEFYTQGNYTTQDVDLVIKNVFENKKISLTFEKLGFKEIGNRTWVLDDIGILIEKVGDSLFSGRSIEVLPIKTSDGFNVNFVNINDIIINRIRGVTYWEETDYLEQIIDLISFNEEIVEFAYIENSLKEVELNVWNNIKLLLDENNLEFRIHNLEKELNSHNIPYGFMANRNEKKGIIYFIVSQTPRNLYIGIDLIVKSGLLVYNEDEEVFEKLELDSSVLVKWNHYKIVNEILKKGGMDMKKDPVKEIVAIQRMKRIRELYPDAKKGRQRPRNPIKKAWLLEQKEKMGGKEIGSI